MAYKQMASLYDQLMADAPCDAWVAFTLEAFRRSGKQITQVADLGCGTGEITKRLAKAGYTMRGVDYSADMLAHADRKANEEKLDIQWLCQDLTELEGLENLDAAVSYCDVINYIVSEDELAAVFGRVAGSLKVGGLFIFDVHALFHVQEHLINQTFADVTDEASYIWFCAEGDHPGEMYHDLTFFALNGTNYEKFTEFHQQRTYSIAFYQQLLKDAGFDNIRVYADFSFDAENIDEEAERIFFVTEKRSE
ncbi:SAM-dependent methyltransferase [Virgibacillus halotolerans]|uniref:class I SAM-dependent DNA methyltransferase n=1 Tax=Virgibacillus halotolerans TaxID=1071053 RepID=UPI0019602507|nr:class I SAM-dependent methyltransferase [Virgibacillus halotolerans]MBM7597902.1 SAM-dependent methyltransferase [Virgibacillus halotolerans]